MNTDGLRYGDRNIGLRANVYFASDFGDDDMHPALVAFLDVV